MKYGFDNRGDHQHHSSQRTIDNHTGVPWSGLGKVEVQMPFIMQESIEKVCSKYSNDNPIDHIQKRSDPFQKLSLLPSIPKSVSGNMPSLKEDAQSVRREFQEFVSVHRAARPEARYSVH